MCGVPPGFPTYPSFSINIICPKKYIALFIFTVSILNTFLMFLCLLDKILSRNLKHSWILLVFRKSKVIYSLHEEPLKKQEVDWKQRVRANTLSVFHYPNSGLKFQKLHVPQGKVTFTSHTDPTQVATARLVIVILNRMDGTGDHDLLKWKGTLRSDRPKWPQRSKLTTSICIFQGHPTRI